MLSLVENEGRSRLDSFAEGDSIKTSVKMTEVAKTTTSVKMTPIKLMMMICN